MTATIPCKAKDGFECPYLKVCVAKLTDRTITGCGMALYVNGLIKYDEIGVQHTVNEGVVAEFDRDWWNSSYQKGGKE